MRHRVRELEQTLARARKRISAANDKYLDGDITKAAYDEVLTRHEAEIDAAEAELRRLTVVKRVPTLPPLERVLAELDGASAALTEGPTARQRDVLTHLVRAVHATRVRWGVYDVRVTWTPRREALREVAHLALARAIA